MKLSAEEYQAKIAKGRQALEECKKAILKHELFDGTLSPLAVAGNLLLHTAGAILENDEYHWLATGFEKLLAELRSALEAKKAWKEKQSLQEQRNKQRRAQRKKAARSKQ